MPDFGRRREALSPEEKIPTLADHPETHAIKKESA
jgi:hypothetical protein